MRSTFSASSPAFCVVTISYFNHSSRYIMILTWFLFAFLWTSFQVSFFQSLYPLHWNISIFFAHFLTELFVLYCFYCSEGAFYMLRTHCFLVWKYFSWSAICLFIFLLGSFTEKMFLILMQSIFFFFHFMNHYQMNDDKHS